MSTTGSIGRTVGTPPMGMTSSCTAEIAQTEPRCRRRPGRLIAAPRNRMPSWLPRVAPGLVSPVVKGICSKNFSATDTFETARSMRSRERRTAGPGMCLMPRIIHRPMGLVTRPSRSSLMVLRVRPAMSRRVRVSAWSTMAMLSSRSSPPLCPIRFTGIATATWFEGTIRFPMTRELASGNSPRARPMTAVSRCWTESRWRRWWRPMGCTAVQTTTAGTHG